MEILLLYSPVQSSWILIFHLRSAVLQDNEHWVFWVSQHLLETVHLRMTLTSLLWCAALQPKLRHKDTLVSRYSAWAAVWLSGNEWKKGGNDLQQRLYLISWLNFHSNFFKSVLTKETIMSFCIIFNQAVK